MQTQQQAERTPRIVVGVFVVAAAVIVAGALLAIITRNSAPASSPGSLFAPSWQEINANFHAMTGVQWLNYEQGLQGREQHNWTGTVYDVQPTSEGEILLGLDMDGDGQADVGGPVSRADAALLGRGQRAGFEGGRIQVADEAGRLYVRVEGATVLH